MSLSAIAAATLVASTLLVALVRRWALARAMIDEPGERRSHTRSTPRGGGLGLVLALLSALVVSAALGLVSGTLLTVLLGAGGAVAVIGWFDDRRHVAARWRLLVHAIACAVTVALLGPVEALVLGSRTIELGLLAVPLSLLAGVWLVNLFNFMDGIDGIAGVELVTVALGLALCAGIEARIFAPTVLAAAAGVGFLYWNRPPARIFLGDVGSGFLGFLLAALVLAGVTDGSVSLWSAVILLGVFVVDATLTLGVRALRREQLASAHRTHAYQHLAQRHGHARVTAGCALVNLCWLLPLAAVAEVREDLGAMLLVVAFAPLLVVAWRAGAGRPAP